MSIPRALTARRPRRNCETDRGEAVKATPSRRCVVGRSFIAVMARAAARAADRANRRAIRARERAARAAERAQLQRLRATEQDARLGQEEADQACHESRQSEAEDLTADAAQRSVLSRRTPHYATLGIRSAFH
jgi:hypothetical protein